ncbi:MAG: hypothetical protein P8Z81_15245 [Deinococcales bacterium]
MTFPVVGHHRASLGSGDVHAAPEVPWRAVGLQVQRKFASAQRRALGEGGFHTDRGEASLEVDGGGEGGRVVDGA